MNGVISISSLLSESDSSDRKEPLKNDQIPTQNGNLLDVKSIQSNQMNKSVSPMSVSNLINDSTSKEATPLSESNGTNTEKNGAKVMKKKPSSTINNEHTETNANKSKKDKTNEPMIINIEIPLSTHNDVHHEFNFVKLVEEKYGRYDTTSNVPLARSSWNEDEGDDEDDEDEDEEQEEQEEQEQEHEQEVEDVPEVEDEVSEIEPSTNNTVETTVDSYYDDEDEIVKALKIKFTPGMSDAEKESLVLKEIHRRKMVNNKRIGKYDVDDPFIDDEELEYEEDTNSNVDGWFIWYGKLDTTQQKKKPVPVVKTEKNGRTTNSSRARPTANNGSTQKRQRESTNTPQPQKKLKKQATPIKSVSSTSTNSNFTKNTDIAITKTPTKTTTDSKANTKPDSSKPEEPVTKENKDAKEKKEKKEDKPSSNIIVGSFGF